MPALPSQKMFWKPSHVDIAITPGMTEIPLSGSWVISVTKDRSVDILLPEFRLQ
jgi:hypothetical protein